MEIELEPRVKPLSYKVKATSRESPSQKASHVLDTDLRTHWSTATNTKEWILLELDESCLLSHIRIYNKSVLEWEIAVGLRYKPETFVKVRPRCEAPRRDMMYPMNYTPCRYVRISCLRGNPIAIFFIQLIGISVTGLEPEFQPVVNHLLPQIVSHKQDAHDMYLQLLQDMTNRLLVFLPHLEADLASFSDAPDSNLRFLAMLAGPFYPILHTVNERDTGKSSGNLADSEVPKNTQSLSLLTVSSNFEPRRSRNTSPFLLSTSSSIVFRADAIFVLLRKAYKDPNLGTVCRMACRMLQKLTEPLLMLDESTTSSEVTSVLDESSKPELINPLPMVDYSNLFGEEFQVIDDHWDPSILNVLDVGAVEEGILHVLYACASQPQLCSKLADSTSDFWSALPLVQALLPALRPYVTSSADHVDETFSQWKQPFVQQALSQIVLTASSPLYHPLLQACAGYLSSYSPSHAKAACVIIDLCCGVLAPWITQVIAKVDLTVELVEDLLGIIQGAQHSMARARAVLKYIVLALSGHMDDILGKYKEVKHNILFLVEMLEPFLDPAICTSTSKIAFGDISYAFPEKQEQTCLIALNIIRTAVRKPAVLPSLESEWRSRSVAPSVLLSILEPRIQLPPEIDMCKFPISKDVGHESLNIPPTPCCDSDGKADAHDTAIKMDALEDVSLLFAPPELRSIKLTNFSGIPKENVQELNQLELNSEQKDIEKKCSNQFQNSLVSDAGFAAEYYNLQADCFQLMNLRDCELKASEFQRLASDLHSQHEISIESHDAAIDALLLAAECYVNPFFVMSPKAGSNIMHQISVSGMIFPKNSEISELRRVSNKTNSNFQTIARLEKNRDKVVLKILLEAAEMDRKYHKRLSDEEDCHSYSAESDEQIIETSPSDIELLDAVTLVRQNQALLCSFLIKRLQGEQHSLHEILMHCLVFLLHSATKLHCTPDHVIDIILHSANYLNNMLTSLYSQFKEGKCQLNHEKIHGIQRRWILLQRLVIASSGAGVGSDFAVNINNCFRHGNLIPPSAWMQKISTFSHSTSPLVRFLGWMAVSRNAKQFIEERLFLTSDMLELTYLLSIFADDLAAVDKYVDPKNGDLKIERSEGKHDFQITDGDELVDGQRGDQSFRVIYPDLYKFFPNMKKQFEAFGEIILEAVGLQLRSLPSAIVPDILCWFSDLCSWTFIHKDKTNSQGSSSHLKGYVAKNARAIILYILEAIVMEHMEALVPEIPRVVQVLVSICRASYCDVSFLDSVLQLLKPIVSYSLQKVSDEEKLLVDDSCHNFESLCFDELFGNIRQRNEIQDSSVEKVFGRARAIFILASVFEDLSFQRRREILQSLTLWTGFTSFEPTTSFHDYLCAFNGIMESCKAFLLQNLRVFNLIPFQLPPFSDSTTLAESGLESFSWFLKDVLHCSTPNKVSEDLESNNVDGVVLNEKNYNLSEEETEEFAKDLENLISKLYPTIEQCWSLHHKLAKKLTITSTQCFMYLRCLSSIAPAIYNAEGDNNENSLPSKSVEQLPAHWKTGLEGLAGIILMLQENACWQVASVMFDCLLGVPLGFPLGNVIESICTAVKSFSCKAPKISWRLQTDKWLSMLFIRGIHSLHENEIPPLIDMFDTMLGHPEPEQRFIVLQHLGRLVGQDADGGIMVESSKFCSKMVSPGLVHTIPEKIISLLVSSSWDKVAIVASTDVSLPLRTRAMALLVDYIPFVDRPHLQSFLAAADSLLYGLGRLVYPVCEGPLLKLSLALITSACLYSPAEDISLIPQKVWENIETLGFSKAEHKLPDLEKKACQVLCRLRYEGDDAKEVLKEVLSSSSAKQSDPEFGSTRESILQVLANLTSVQSYFDIFAKETDQEAMELEEAEMELDLIQKDGAPLESMKDSKEENQLLRQATPVKDENRLQQIKDCIHSLEKTKLREDIVARRQQKILMRRSRQKHLEEAALREAELLQELDRERTAEAEKEIERQRLLELERAKTRELRHNLDMEKERQTQRELQRELEQAESGLRSSRRDFPSSSHSRPRERYRERENGRPTNEGSTRTGSSGLQPETVTSSSMAAAPTVVLSGSRSFSGQPPTILQSRDRADECSSSYEENFDGSKDSGDTGSVGDPELVSAFDGQSGGFGSSQRHGSRGSKTRQLHFNCSVFSHLQIFSPLQRLAMATVRNLKIKTSTCKRIVKELHSYEKEVEREAAKTADMKEKGADPYDLKQQENVLAESRMMIPDCRKRLEASLADLKATLVELEEANEKEGPEFEDARSTITEVEKLFQTEA
ncbi:Tubulin binding cofactor A [Corchorus capsularis]|uniref:Tubulin binding cofactor A n=1 Tax=Corchorus capsularis TaxID=210143 RepID=A0A1R3JE48_COCAP|nr:Tubulin binding cofactor A [Corchorus capsularis]